MSQILTPTTARVRAEGRNVVVIKGGRTVFDMPWDAALALARAIYAKAKEAEEFAHAEAIVLDQAILTRLGVPIGLSDNRDIQQAAGREAAWNSKLRRYLPGGVRSQEIFGTPTIINHGEKHDGARRK